MTSCPRRAVVLFVAFTLAGLAGCDEELVCPSGETACGKRCVSLAFDEANCGGCDVVCGPLEACGGGACACASGIGSCGGSCIDLARDPAHCGACDVACGAGQLCSTAGGASGCVASCGEGRSTCAGACVELGSDPYHCGACGRRCAQGESCRAGECRAEIYVACYASGDVRPVDAALGGAGAPISASGSPQALDVTDLAIYTANGFPAGVGVAPLGAAAARVTPLAGDDVQDVLVHRGAVLASNSGSGTLVALDATGGFRDEVAIPVDQPNPHGIAVHGGTAYVALFGRSRGADLPPTGQAIARIDVERCLDAGARISGATSPPTCAIAGTPIDLNAVPGAAPEGGFPFPSQALAIGSRVFVTLSALAYADCGGGFFDWCRPAGSGRLAVVDTAAGDAVSIVDLGAGCGNPGDLAAAGDTLWVSCGSFTFPRLAPGALVPVAIGGAPSVGSPVSMPPGFVPGKLAFCGGTGYVTDQASGAVLRFDPVGRTVEDPVTVCPTVFFAWAADVACSE